MRNKLKPCDCVDMEDVRKLDHQGISWGNKSIGVHPNIVEIKIDHTTIQIPMKIFKQFAEWYLSPQQVPLNKS